MGMGFDSGLLSGLSVAGLFVPLSDTGFGEAGDDGCVAGATPDEPLCVFLKIFDFFPNGLDFFFQQGCFI